MCDRINMHQVLAGMEKRRAGSNLFRYQAGKRMKEVSAETFFRDVRICAYNMEYSNLCGRHIGIMGKNSYEWMVSFCAVLWIGSVAVLLDRQMDSDILMELADRVDLDTLLYDNSVTDTVCAADWKAQIHLQPMEEFIQERKNEKDPSFHPLLEQKKEDLACIFFTSGTTGKNKAVMLSSGGLTASVCCQVNDKPFHSLLAVLPFHHMAGFVMVMNALYLGAEVCLADDLRHFYRYLKEMKPDYVPMVPSMLPVLVRKLKKGGIHGKDLGWNLHMIHCGGAAFRPEFLQILLEHDILVLQGYGASEAGGIGFMWEMSPDRPDTIGKPPAQMQVKMIDGELYLKSESVMIGYYGDPEGTEQVLHDGWYATGDLCRSDADGYLYLTGRKKNLIILSNGENISPEEIETRLYACEDIQEVMVGVEKEMLMAAVYPACPSSASESDKQAVRERIEEFIKQYNRKVPMYKQIHQIRFLEEPFVKTAVGKLIRHNRNSAQ